MLGGNDYDFTKMIVNEKPHDSTTYHGNKGGPKIKTYNMCINGRIKVLYGG
jgi:hypothetical protein